MYRPYLNKTSYPLQLMGNLKQDLVISTILFTLHSSCTTLNIVISGVPPETFQGRGGLMKLEHFDKHFTKTQEKKGPEKVLYKIRALFFDAQNSLEEVFS